MIRKALKWLWDHTEDMPPAELIVPFLVLGLCAVVGVVVGILQLFGVDLNMEGSE